MTLSLILFPAILVILAMAAYLRRRVSREAVAGGGGPVQPFWTSPAGFAAISVLVLLVGAFVAPRFLGIALLVQRVDPVAVIGHHLMAGGGSISEGPVQRRDRRFAEGHFFGVETMGTIIAIASCWGKASDISLRQKRDASRYCQRDSGARIKRASPCGNDDCGAFSGTDEQGSGR